MRQQRLSPNALDNGCFYTRFPDFGKAGCTALVREMSREECWMTSRVVGKCGNDDGTKFVPVGGIEG